MAISSKHVSSTGQDTPIPKLKPPPQQKPTPRSSRSSGREKKEIPPVAAPERDSSAKAVTAVTQTSARSDAAPLRSSRERQKADSARAPSASTSGLMSVRSSNYSLETPRNTACSTTTAAMSTARAEATLAVLEAERAQLEHRLKKVEEELELQEALAINDRRQRGKSGPPRRAAW